MRRFFALLMGFGLAAGSGAEAQTRLKLSTITPGTEQVQLVSNGDFQLQGPLVSNSYPTPTGWNRNGNIFATAGSNTVAANLNVVAKGQVGTGAPDSGYSRSVTLEPATAYVFSAYMWNMGNASNRVNTVIDFADVPGEPQVVLTYADSEADKGYFVYHSFNTSTTGTNILVRLFYDGLTNAGCAPGYFPVAAQWDNLAITKASEFVAPLPSNAIVTPPLPFFRITLAETNVLLSWPATNGTMIVQSATSLAPPVQWQNVTNVSIALSNDLNQLTLARNTTQRFFRLVPEVDPSTMYHKLLMGYQGWFACQGDGSGNGWVHWFHGNGSPTDLNANFDLWPDTSELDADELFATTMTYSNGTTAKLYSAYKQKTVVRHFKWMQDNHLDGVFFQRFLSDLPGGNISTLRNQVAVNVRVGAETYGRVFAIMYDISGYPTNSLVSKLTNDWLYLVNTQHVTNSPAYLHHNGKPVVAIWGWGFSGRQDTPAQAQQVIDWFKAAGCTVMGGLPTNWRTLNGDAQTNPAWSNVFRAFDVISPWSVGRYGNNSGADNFRVNQIVPDLAAATAAGRDYLPVIFPGFSWHNMHDRNPQNPFNQTPRNGGEFYWRQAYNAVRSGCTMIYGAMFDEVDEGTAMFKMMPTSADLPAQGIFMPLNIDGINLPSDWYLRLADQAGRMLRGEIPQQSTIPISP